MSLGGSELDAVEKAAIDYAIAQGVIIVAAAGNGANRHGLPGRLPAGDHGGRLRLDRRVAPDGNRNWWWPTTSPIPPRQGLLHHRLLQPAGWPARTSTSPPRFAGSSAPTSSTGQHAVLLPRRHLHGLPARRRHRGADGAEEPDADLTEAESILTFGSAIPLPAGCRMVRPLPGLAPAQVCWGDNASGSGLATADAALVATPRGEVTSTSEGRAGGSPLVFRAPISVPGSRSAGYIEDVYRETHSCGFSIFDLHSLRAADPESARDHSQGGEVEMEKLARCARGFTPRLHARRARRPVGPPARRQQQAQQVGICGSLSCQVRPSPTAAALTP